MLQEINVKLEELAKDEWVVVKGDGEYFDAFLIKVEGTEKVSVLSVSGGAITPAAYVIEEGIFKYDVQLATTTLMELTVEQLVFELIENNNTSTSTDLIFDLLINSSNAASYPNYEEMKKFVYVQDLEEELPETFEINGETVEVLK